MKIFNIFLTIILTAFSVSCTTRLQNVDAPVNISNQPELCAFPGLELPDNFQVYAAGAYSGRDTGFQIDQSGHEGTQIDAVINKPDFPVVLLLGAYEPTIWNISHTPETDIQAVLVSGYHRQVIAGLEESIPATISTYENRGDCGYFYVSADNLDSLNPIARRVYEQAVDLVYLAENGSVTIGEPVTPDTALLSSSAVTPESYIDESVPVAGPAGLEDAVRKNLLRVATRTDAQDWEIALQDRLPQADVPPVAGQEAPPPGRIILLNAYVVQKAFTFPSGLYGANAGTFFVPDGVPVPDGNPGHSTIYDFNTMTCRGSLCNTR